MIAVKTNFANRSFKNGLVFSNGIVFHSSYPFRINGVNLIGVRIILSGPIVSRKSGCFVTIWQRGALLLAKMDY